MARLPNPLALVAGSTGTAPPAIVAADYGIVLGSTSAAAANRQTLNALMRLAELNNTVVVLPASTAYNGTIYLDAPLVQRFQTGIEGPGGGSQFSMTTLRAAPGANCNVRQMQRYIPGAAAFAGSTAYNTTYSAQATSFVTYGGYYYACILGYTSGATTPPNDPQHWCVLSPVNTTTFNNAGATLNQTPQSLVVTDGTQFGTYGGVMQFTVAGTTYNLLYAGVSGNTLLGCTVSTGSVAIAGNETIFPNDASHTSARNLIFHGGLPSSMSPGRFDHVDNYSSTLGGDFNLNVTVQGGTGDGWGAPTTASGGLGGAGYSGQRVHVGCTSLANAGTGKIATVDSLTNGDVVGRNGLGGHLVQTGATQIAGASKSWNNGLMPIFKAQRTIASGQAVITGTTTITVTGANFTSDDLGQGIWDGSAPGTGGLIPANTFIISVTSATVATLSQPATNGTTGTTLTIGGYYFWPVLTGGTGVNLTGCVGSTDGIFYVLKVASVTNASQPSGDTTNWQPIRTAYEWGWSVTEINSVSENRLELDCQADKFGAYNANNSNCSVVAITANGWISNPLMWNGSSGAVISAYTVPAGLSTAGCVNLGSSVGHNVRIAARQVVSSGSIGTLVQAASATNCNLSMSSDTRYGATIGGVVAASNSVTVNGVSYGTTALDFQTLYTGPAGGTSGLCLGQTMDRRVPNASNAGTSGAIHLMAVAIPGGVTITKLGWISGGTAATGPQNQWLGLFDNNLNMLCNTADQTSAAVAANTAYQYAVATIASGAAAAFTTTYSGLHYIGLLLKASTTIATQLGTASATATFSNLAPVSSYLTASSVTSPPGYPYTATLSSASGQNNYYWVS